MICDATIVGHLLAAHHVIQVYIQKLSDGFLILTAVFFFSWNPKLLDIRKPNMLETLYVD